MRYFQVNRQVLIMLLSNFTLALSACTVRISDIQLPNPNHVEIVRDEQNNEIVIQEKNSNKVAAKALFDQAVALYHARDYHQALALFISAKEKGHMKAPRYLGLMYLNGEGVVKDSSRAFAEFSIAARQGDITSQYWLAYLYENGIGTVKDLDQAVLWYKKSAERGDAISQPAIDALKRLNHD